MEHKNNLTPKGEVTQTKNNDLKIRDKDASFIFC